MESGGGGGMHEPSEAEALASWTLTGILEDVKDQARPVRQKHT